MKRLNLIGLLGFGILLFVSSCKKDTFTSNSGSLYVPATADVTTTATLTDLQNGRTLYVNKCGSCHNLYSPDSYSSANWSSILTSMAPKAGLTSTEKSLVLKYVTRGK